MVKIKQIFKNELTTIYGNFVPMTGILLVVGLGMMTFVVSGYEYGTLLIMDCRVFIHFPLAYLSLLTRWPTACGPGKSGMAGRYGRTGARMKELTPGENSGLE